MKRLVAIDGIRGIAILMVVSFHYLNVQLVNSTSTIGKIFSKATYFGWVGVDLFFVLSGFLIGTILLKNKTSKNYFSTFYIRRIVRIIPNYYLLLIIYIVINFFEVFKNDYNLTGNNVIPIWSYFLMVHNFFMAHINNLGNESIVITWSIGIEEQFYLLIPFVLYKMNSRFLPWFEV